MRKSFAFLRKYAGRDPCETPVVRLIVAGKLRDGSTVRVDAAGDALRVEPAA